MMVVEKLTFEIKSIWQKESMDSLFQFLLRKTMSTDRLILNKKYQKILKTLQFYMFSISTVYHHD